MPELSAWVEETPKMAFGQSVEPACQDVHGTYRVFTQFVRPGSPGPHSGGTSSLAVNFISPNSCQVDDSSCPALRKNTKSYFFAVSSPTSATHAARASARR